MKRVYEMIYKDFVLLPFPVCHYEGGRSVVRAGLVVFGDELEVAVDMDFLLVNELPEHLADGGFIARAYGSEKFVGSEWLLAEKGEDALADVARIGLGLREA